jgi:Fic family protein
VLAQTLGVSQVSVNRWLNRKAVPTRRLILDRIGELYARYAVPTEADSLALEQAELAVAGLHFDVGVLLGDRELLDEFTARLTYHTGSIEGSTMTLADVTQVLFNDAVLRNRTAIEQVEARNHAAALDYVLSGLSDHGADFVITEAFISQVHLRLMNGILSDAGFYRNHQVRIARSRTVTANYASVPQKMARLIPELNRTNGPLLAQMARVHAAFEQIHPFADGNGRVGRLLLVVLALRRGIVPPIIQKDRKQVYYADLELAQTQERYEPLAVFLGEEIQATYAWLSPPPVSNRSAERPM